MIVSLRVAVLAYTASSDLRANRKAIATAVEQAAAQQVAVLVTPECALCGYPAATGMLNATSCELAEYEEELLGLASKRGLVLALGTVSPDGRGGVANLAVVGGAVPVQRLAKRALTPADTAWFAPGPARSVVVRIGAWQVAVGICYEVRQAAWWYAAAEAGADAAIVLAHQAGADPDPGTKAAVLPALHAARAAELAMPLLLANTAAADRWLDSAAWDARGRCIASKSEGLLISEFVHRDALDPWYNSVRRDALAAWRTR